MKNVDMNPNARLSFLERFAYGTGDYAANLVYSAISAFLLVYYTNVIGASAQAAASIIAVSKFLDGISDLIMGYIVDHTNSKYGKARPWIARLCIPLAVCTVLMFSVPASFTGKIQIAYMFLTYNLVSTIFYTGVNVPYATLQGLMTTDQYERGILGNIRNLLATAGTMTINTVVLKMTGFFGGGDAYTQQGWTMTFVVLMIVFVVLNMFVFLNCRERVVESSGAEGEHIPFLKGLAGLVHNKYWMLMVATIFVSYFMMSCFYGAAMYYAMYNMGNDGYYAGVANALSIAQIVTLFITPFLMKRFSKKDLMLWGTLISGIGFAMSGVMTGYMPNCIASVIKGIGFGASGAAMYGLLQDAITYGEWHNGYGNAGMGNAASSFCMKVGSGIGTAALGWILAAGGFDASQAVQSASALFAINFSFAWVSVIGSVIGVICMVFYDLDKYYDKVVADLAQGRHRV